MAISQHTGRRAVLKGIPAVAAALVAGRVEAATWMAPAPEGDTPILRLFRRHRALIEAARLHGPADDDEYDRLFYREADAIEAEMVALPCTCAADFAAKVIVDTCEGELFADWKTGALWREARELVGAA